MRFLRKRGITIPIRKKSSILPVFLLVISIIYYRDKGDIYCALLEDYCSNSCKAMKELLDQLATFEDRAACKEFLLKDLNSLLERFDGTNRFFEDSVIIAKENTRVQEIISRAEEDFIAMVEMFLKRRYPEVRGRFLYQSQDDIYHYRQNSE